MNKLTSEDNAQSTAEVVRQEYRSLSKNATLKFVLYCERQPWGKSYSIQCVKYIGSEPVCQATAPDVSSSRSFAEEMLLKLADGGVEPVILCDVVYDLLP